MNFPFIMYLIIRQSIILIKGVEENGSCIEHFDCDSGFFCDSDSLSCKEQFEFGLTCKSDFECVNNCLCNHGKCIFYFSLSNAEKSQSDMACTSGNSSMNILYHLFNLIYSCLANLLLVNIFYQYV